MPSRLLREGILDSDAVNSLSWPAEVFYRRLMSVVDDFGLFDGRLEVLRSRLYALKLEEVRAADVERWIAECVKAGLIRCYDANSKPYLLFHKLGAIQRSKPKFPEPPENNCLQLKTVVPGSGSGAHSGSGAGARASPRAEISALKAKKRRQFEAGAAKTAKGVRA